MRDLQAQGRNHRIDISDGLAVDGGRLCRASGVGCVFDQAAIAPRSDAGRLAAHLGLDPLELVLGGGEDYVLLFTLPADAAFKHPLCRRIGHVSSRPGMSLLRRDGRLDPLPPEGWDHLG